MNERNVRRWLAIAGILGGAFAAGCAPAADLGMKMAGAVVESALKDGPKDGSSAAPDPAESQPANETACRKKLREWREADGNPRAEPPAYLRCGPTGEWPDESEVRRAGSAPGL